MITGVEAAPREYESYRGSKKIECNVAENETLRNRENNAQTEVQIDDEKNSYLTIRFSTLEKQMTIFQCFQSS